MTTSNQKEPVGIKDRLEPTAGLPGTRSEPGIMTEASDIIADLHEAMRRQRVGLIVDERTVRPLVLETPWDWACPIYDCRALPDLGDRCEGLAAQAAEQLRAGVWSLDQQLAIISELHEGPDPAPVKVAQTSVTTLRRAVANSPSGPFEVLRGRAYGLDMVLDDAGRPTGRALLYGNYVWTLNLDFAVAFGPGPRLLRVHKTGKFINFADHPDALPFQDFWAWIRTAIGALSAAPTWSEAEMGRSQIAVNAGRARGKLAPIPPIRILHVDRIVTPRHEGEPSGREVSPHYRRATVRRYRHARFINMQGQEGPVRETIVRADRGDPATPIYKVLP